MSGSFAQSLNAALPRYAPTIPNYTAVPASASVAVFPVGQSPYAAAVTYQHYVPIASTAPYVATPHPIYTTAANGTPVNVSNGAVRTEARSIFLSNLSYAAGPTEVENLLRRAGNPIRVDVPKDARTGRFRGSGTASFATREEASNAINLLNNVKHMGTRIHVRWARETTTVATPPNPLVVDGSNRVRKVTISSSGGAEHIIAVGKTLGGSCRRRTP
ncbi:hypothetical protein W97_02495 [Coniosporium apollinis CBS 100218]|uniref:RRM domain-containing protein n=1 Tax=Coniosporium apollinis (strain CBS 100218) TaxID=1168221 RepID=R7YN26_CONA1|nr:uncharacterized protein W97_02495 [Coniosporium apollinis CBS 100218]EON63268.1 hypothetical protein W97_02495 [Coniosporium apollinis CBS 100218]